MSHWATTSRVRQRRDLVSLCRCTRTSLSTPLLAGSPSCTPLTVARKCPRMCQRTLGTSIQLSSPPPSAYSCPSFLPLSIPSLTSFLRSPWPHIVLALAPPSQILCSLAASGPVLRLGPMTTGDHTLVVYEAGPRTSGSVLDVPPTAMPLAVATSFLWSVVSVSGSQVRLGV